MTPSPRLRAILFTAILLVVAFDIAFLWHRLAHASSAEFRGSRTEAAHYLSGLALRDYVANGRPGGLHSYLEKYRWHYPLVELRSSPIFHTLEAAWMLAVGEGRTRAFLLMAAMAAIFASIIFRLALPAVGLTWSFVAGIAGLCLPSVQRAYFNVDPSLLCVTFLLGAVIAITALLETHRWTWAVSFVLLAFLAVAAGTHLIVIAILVVGTPLLARQFAVFKRPAFWGTCTLLAALIALWLRVLGYEQVQQVASIRPSSTASLAGLANTLRFSCGPVLLIFALYGILTRFRGDRLQPVRWSAIGSVLLGSVVASLFIDPAAALPLELIAVAALLLFAVAGASAFAQPAPASADEFPKPHPVKTAMAFVVFAIGTGALLIPLPYKDYSGMGSIAAEVVRTAKEGEAILVSSDEAGEGAFMAEVAMRDKARPSFTIHRASRLPESKSAKGVPVNRNIESEEQLLTFLHRTNVRYLIQDEALPELDRSRAYDFIRQIVPQRGANFLRQAHADSVREGLQKNAGIVLYRVENLDQ